VVGVVAEISASNSKTSNGNIMIPNMIRRHPPALPQIKSSSIRPTIGMRQEWQGVDTAEKGSSQMPIDDNQSITISRISDGIAGQ
jgi:hypothetical protein